MSSKVAKKQYRQKAKKTMVVAAKAKRTPVAKMPAKKKTRSRRPPNKALVVGRTDARVATSSDIAVMLTNQLSTITVDKFFSIDNLVWLTRGYISKALEKGFAAGSSTQDVPWFAEIFMVNLLANYVQGQVVPVTQLPYWVLCLCHALSPKSVKFGAGSVSYKFAITGTLPYAPSANTATIGPFVYGYQYTTGFSGGAPINGFPTVSGTPGTYSDQLGASAFQELCQFMTKAVGGDPAMSKMVPSSLHTAFEKDVSVFALFKLPEGTGSSGAGGGIYGQLQLEVPIYHPLLALVSSAEDSLILTVPTRNFNWSIPVSGDPTMLGSFMSSNLTERQLSAKRHNRFKPVDFLEFGDVLAQWIQGIIQARINKAQTGGVVAGPSILDYTCPLTLQEVLLLLRNTMMGAFKDSQAAVQGIYPFIPTSGTDNQFSPFVASSTQCSIDTLDMNLPIPFVENIRALIARMLQYLGEQDVVWYMPILGQYAMDVLDSADYIVIALGNDALPHEYPVFATGAIFESEEVSPKGIVTVLPLVEAAISMVDGSSGSSLVFINDPERLKMLCVLWNRWLNGSGVSSFSTALCTLGTEKGINVLCSVAMTRVWSEIGGTRKHDVPKKETAGETTAISTQGSIGKKSSKRFVDKRLKGAKMRSVTSTVFADRKAVIDLSQGEIIASAYEQVLGTWILPIDDNEAIIGEESTVIQRWQFIMEEPFSKARTSGETGVSLATLHATYAAKMVRGDLAPKDDWSEFFTEMARLGRGGI